MLIRSIILLMLMCAASYGAVAFRPTALNSEQSQKFDLETIIPIQFGEWHLEGQGAAIMVNPQQRELIERIYAQTLSRTYANANGDRVMLSLAYAGGYGKSMESHKPERCYPAQGFHILSESKVDLNFDGNVVVPATRLVAKAGNRIEPITYWLIVGGAPTGFGLPMRIQQIKIGLTGKIPDGLLFRVSTINPDEPASFELERQFVQALLRSLPSSDRVRLTGPNQ